MAAKEILVKKYVVRLSGDPHELKCWSKHLGITPEELLRLVDKVGNTAAVVRKELGHERQQ